MGDGYNRIFRLSPLPGSIYRCRSSSLRDAPIDALAILVEGVDHAAELLGLHLVALDQQVYGCMAEEYLQGLFAFGDWKNKLLYAQNWTSMTCYTFDGKFVRSVPAPKQNMGAAGLFDDCLLYTSRCV